MSLDPGLLAAHDFTPVRAALLRVLGGDAVAALVVTRIAWRCAGPQAVDGWWCGTHEALADEIGLSADQVRKAAGRLKAAGHIETEKRRTGGVWDQTLSYRPIVTDMSVCAHPAQEPNGDGTGAECHPAQEPNVPSLLKTLGDARADTKNLTEATRLCHLLSESLKDRGYKTGTNVTKDWVADMERMIRIDGRSPNKVASTIGWLATGRDETAVFWRKNIRSPAKLREHWDRMAEEYRERKPEGANGHAGTVQVISAPRIVTPKPSLPDGEVMLNDGRIQLADGTIVDRSPMPVGPGR